MSEYGSIFKAKDIKKQLLEFNKGYNNRQTFGEYYGTVDLARQQAETQLKQNYDTAILDAYKANYEQQQAIQNSNLGIGYKEEYARQLDADLMQAYNSYASSYNSDMQSVQEGYQESVNKIDAELTDYANKVKTLAVTPYDYLEYIWTKYQEGNDDLQKYFENDATWNKYVKNGELISRNELRKLHFDENDFITAAGTDFYDQMMHQLGNELGEDYSYSKWLNDTNKELYDWSQQNNLYDFTYDGTNMDTFKTLLGMSSVDDEYQFVERYGGLTNEEISKMFDKYYKTVETIEASLYEQGSGKDKRKGDRMDAVLKYETALDELEKISKDLGVYDELDASFEGGWNGIRSDILSHHKEELGTREIKKASRKAHAEKTIERILDVLSLDLDKGYEIHSTMGPKASLPEYKKKYQENFYSLQSNEYNKAKKEYLDAIAMTIKYLQDTKPKETNFNYN